jgi:dCMP deaminase
MPSRRLTNDEYYLSLLEGVAARGSCVRRQVGAIIVDEHHRIFTGFNGPPKGFPHCGEVASSPCPNNHQYWDMGRCIRCGKTCNEISHETRTRERVLCNGQNEPKGVTNSCMAVHAEINAILKCPDVHQPLTLYVSCTPCRNCALVIANTGIKRVVTLEKYADDSLHILEAAGCSVVIVSLPTT